MSIYISICQTQAQTLHKTHMYGTRRNISLGRHKEDKHAPRHHQPRQPDRHLTPLHRAAAAAAATVEQT